MKALPIAIIVGSIALGIAFVAVVGKESPETKQKHVDRLKVYRCEQQYDAIKDERRVEPSTLRVAWEACQTLRRDYRQKWGFDP